MTDRAERVQALRSRTDFPPSWRPGPDNPTHPNPLTAEVLGYTSYDSPEYGTTYICQTQEIDPGSGARREQKWSVFLIPRALQDLKGLTPGTFVSVKYDGMQQSKKTGRSFHAYSVMVEPHPEKLIDDNAFVVPQRHDDDSDIPF